MPVPTHLKQTPKQSWIWCGLTGLPPEIEPIHRYVEYVVDEFTKGTVELPSVNFSARLAHMSLLEISLAVVSAIESAASQRRCWLELEDLAFLKN